MYCTITNIDCERSIILGHGNDPHQIVPTLSQPSIYMTLLSRTDTAASAISVKRLAYMIHDNSKSPSKAYILALGATIFDLLRAAAYQPLRSCFRPMASGSFSHCPIGYKIFKRVLDDLMAKGFIDVTKGWKGLRRDQGAVTRIRITTLMLEQLLKDGLTPKNVIHHFTCPSLIPPAATECPIKLKGSSYRIKGKKFPAANMYINRDDPTFQALSSTMIAINSFLSEHHLSLGNDDPLSYFNGLQRIFHLGDKSYFKWNKSGRLYGYGHCYQSLSKEDRKGLSINKERVAEIDISACFATILHSIKKLPIPNRSDLYGGVDVPRAIMKDYVNAALGAGRFPSRWTKEHKEKHGFDLQKRFPINIIKEKAVNILPILDCWGEGEISWADLHYLESSIIVDAISSLMKDHGIPCYPVHDSIIIPESKTELAKQCLYNSFVKFTGVEPTLKIK
ncbi:hypothetical protein [Sphingomonas carotinifaciens]|uniref:Uncharacterized protein n=1 Tax=Sphingomonas carotinifaciens TaxID=1166323 RepID=A0A1G7HW94_9SPHN|nr:hypothetical protein [Sphingomonas carotinifaciens]MBB4085104.1 hypothetical protein [Sphingomonas carotinifaciens]MWC44482.1 hypothetical protein [Sphingomonas carotinifaciens]SDF04359.1 hypothetical protein SAMN05216557_10215 [Sphingomonas carotinifaciens]